MSSDPTSPVAPLTPSAAQSAALAPHAPPAAAQDTAAAALSSWRAPLAVGAALAAEALVANSGSTLTAVTILAATLSVGAWGAAAVWGLRGLGALVTLAARLLRGARLGRVGAGATVAALYSLGALSSALWAEGAAGLRDLGAVGVGALLLTPALVWGLERAARRLSPAAPPPALLPRALPWALPWALWALWALALLSEETLLAVRPGAAPLHAALLLGSAGVTWLALALAAMRARLSARFALLALALALAAADRHALSGLYEGVHEWLFWLSVAALAVAASSPSAVTAPEAAPLRGDGRRALRGALPLTLTLALAAAGAARQATHGPTRLAVKRSLGGAHALSIARSTRERLGGGSAQVSRDLSASHPALRYDQRLDAPLPNELRRPHIVLITIDALRSQAIQGRSAYMPELRDLAEQGLSFRRAYAAGSRTAIGMTSVHFGLYSREVEWEKWPYYRGQVFPPSSKRGRALIKKGGRFVYTTIPKPPAHGRLAERLHEAGYLTAAAPYAGYNDFFKPGVGFERGFDVFRDLSEVRWPKESAPKVTAAALGALDELLGGAPASRARPVFLWAHYYDPHESRGSPERYRQLAGVTDKGLAELFEGLRARGVLDEALVLVTSDHGEAMREHGMAGHATSLFEEQVRVPFVLWLGERLRADLRAAGAQLKPRVSGDPVSHIDVTATLAAAAGASVEGLSGLNLLPSLLSAAPLPRRALISELHRYVGSQGQLSSDLSAVWLDGWKLIVDHRAGEQSLFHLLRDAAERRDLAASEEEVSEEEASEEAASEGAQGAERGSAERLAELRAVVEAFRARGYSLP